MTTIIFSCSPHELITVSLALMAVWIKALHTVHTSKHTSSELSIDGFDIWHHLNDMMKLQQHHSAQVEVVVEGAAVMDVARKWWHLLMCTCASRGCSVCTGPQWLVHPCCQCTPSFFLWMHVGSCMLRQAWDELESQQPDLCPVLARILSACVVGGNQKKYIR